MPTYEYVCDSCGHDFEVFQRMSDEPVSVCPECGEPVRRVISGGLGINFRGSGFYVNDSSSAPKAASGGCSGCSSSSCSTCKH